MPSKLQDQDGPARVHWSVSFVTGKNLNDPQKGERENGGKIQGCRNTAAAVNTPEPWTSRRRVLNRKPGHRPVTYGKCRRSPHWDGVQVGTEAGAPDSVLTARGGGTPAAAFCLKSAVENGEVLALPPTLCHVPSSTRAHTQLRVPHDKMWRRAAP